MAIIVKTAQPEQVVNCIIDGIEHGHIVTWRLTSNGNFTQTTKDDQWDKKAYFKPITKNGQLIFNIKAPKDGVIDVEIYAVYHGRFIEMLLSHCDGDFESASATAQPTNGHSPKQDV